MRKQTIWLGQKNLTQCKQEISTAQIKAIDYDRFYKSPNKTGNWPELVTGWWEGPIMSPGLSGVIITWKGGSGRDMIGKIGCQSKKTKNKTVSWKTFVIHKGQAF